MPTAEVQRRRKSSERSKPRSRTHRASRDHDPISSTAPTSAERPATIEDLRKARVTYLETPVSERRERMKYEYVKTVPVKVRLPTTEVRTSRTRSNTERTRTSSRRPSRTERTRESGRAARITDDADQYVYHMDSVSERQHDSPTNMRHPHGLRANDVSETVPRRPERRSTARRHTAPTLRRESRGAEDAIDNSVLETTRPPLRKSTTAVSETVRRTLSRNLTDTSKTEVDVTKSSSTEKKSSGVFGGLFASKPPPSEKKVSCLTCGDEVPPSRAAKLPCTHRMCHSCLKRIFKLSITDPSHMPPRCCTDKHIDLKHVDSLFNMDFKKTYNRKFKEYKAKNRIYCPKRGCGEWIQPKHIFLDKGRRVGRCPSCKMYVCGICSQKMHKSKDCPKDPATKEFVEVAQKAGWQKCYSCSAMVELKEGCNHMTCRCTAEFCMVCGLKWKSCDCPWFSYEQVDGLGDPVRYQQEMDRRREQEQRDEELARRMEGLNTEDAQGNAFNFFAIGNNGGGGGRRMNQNFIQQAREALTANYQQADQAARGLLTGFLTGREPALLEPQNFEDEPAQPRPRPPFREPAPRHDAPFDPAEGPTFTPAGIPHVRRQATRRRGAMHDLFENRTLTAAEREQARHLREWADHAPL